MKYCFSCFKNNKYLMRADLDDGEGEVWAETTKAVHEFAKDKFEKNEDCNIQWSKENGGYKITRITKLGQGNSNPKGDTMPNAVCEQCGKALKDSRYTKCYACNKGLTKKASSSSSEFKCEDCGASLKDGRYKKCYTCNQKNPVAKKTDNSIGDSIDLQNIRHAVSRIVNGMLVAVQGQVDVNSVTEITKGFIEEVTNKLKEMN